MNPFEIKEALQTFTVIVDSREHYTAESKERYAAFGSVPQKATIDYGDYCGNIILPSGKWLHDVTSDERIRPMCSVERKQSMDELAGNFTKGRDRFRREFERGFSNKAKMYLLVENCTWEGISMHRYRSKFNPEAYMASLVAWTIRYNITPVFCKSGTMSGRMIMEILYRDMKERLERGEFG